MYYHPDITFFFILSVRCVTTQDIRKKKKNENKNQNVLSYGSMLLNLSRRAFESRTCPFSI